MSSWFFSETHFRVYLTVESVDSDGISKQKLHTVSGSLLDISNLAISHSNLLSLSILYSEKAFSLCKHRHWCLTVLHVVWMDEHNYLDINLQLHCDSILPPDPCYPYRLHVQWYRYICLQGRYFFLGFSFSYAFTVFQSYCQDRQQISHFIPS